MKDGWIYGVDAIAAVLGMSRRTLHRILKSGQIDLPVVKIGGRWGAHPADLQRWKRQES